MAANPRYEERCIAGIWLEKVKNTAECLDFYRLAPISNIGYRAFPSFLFVKIASGPLAGQFEFSRGTLWYWQRGREGLNPKVC